jgi:hypothetical protein
MSDEVKAVSGVLIPVETTGKLPNLQRTPSAPSPKRMPATPFAVAVSDVYEVPSTCCSTDSGRTSTSTTSHRTHHVPVPDLRRTDAGLDVNVAADFIYMAAVLIHIKSKMPPRDPLARPRRGTIRAAGSSIGSEHEIQVGRTDASSETTD